ncbi:hypothetical protein HF521_020100 [Silurus meridionalis]|uniref:C-C motif chemokine n=1 Tax=Silurus meridionalis TaxID=175797 RepID=A0A8T0BN42_SILME|nr:hypothetical protein HF521_020100 [Silurus meridionalis]
MLESSEMNETKKLFSCSLCSLSYKSQIDLHIHIDTCHYVESGEIKNEDMTPAGCSRSQQNPSGNLPSSTDLKPVEEDLQQNQESDPEDTRVGRIMYRIDRLRFDSHAPQLCCYRFHVHPIPARLITGYKVTDHQCNNHGVIFILKDNRNFCVDPNENWVQNIMNTTDKTENAKTQELLCHYGRGPGHCCFSFHDDQIYSEFITGYEETAHHSPNHGIIFSLKDGRRVCTNYNNEWVKTYLTKIYNQLIN